LLSLDLCTMDGFGDDFSANKEANGDDDFDVRAGEEKEVAAVNSEAGSLSAMAAESSSSSRPATISPARLQEPPREDPEPIKKWKEEQTKRLENKDREEEAAQIALKEQAKKELEDWYKGHSEQLGKMQSSNRAASESAEKEFKSTTFEIKPGTEWDRVSKLCDFNPKTARNTKDVSRMRSVILQLKQTTSSSSC